MLHVTAGGTRIYNNDAYTVEMTNDTVVSIDIIILYYLTSIALGTTS